MAILKFKRLSHGADLPLPRYQTEHSAGMDLHAAVERDLELPAGARALIPTGLQMGLPAGYEGQIRPRSGLALSNGVTVLNAPGTIDADYRGEVMVVLVNLGAEPFIVARGMRIAQMVIAPVSAAKWRELDGLDETERGGGGFGSTGTDGKA